jgi:hypothetical protein
MVRYSVLLKHYRIWGETLMVHYQEEQCKIIDAILGNSKAKQARVLYCMARDFKSILPACAIADLINNASKIIFGSEIVTIQDIENRFNAPLDEIKSLQEQGCTGKVLKVTIKK